MAIQKEVDLTKLYNLAKMGLSEEQIGVSLGISVSTISRRKKDDEQFAETLKAGKQAGITAVTNSLFTAATDEAKPNMSAAIFYLKNRGGWRDKQEVDANISGIVTVEHDIESALQALRDAGIDPSSL